MWLPWGHVAALGARGPGWGPMRAVRRAGQKAASAGPRPQDDQAHVQRAEDGCTGHAPSTLHLGTGAVTVRMQTGLVPGGPSLHQQTSIYWPWGAAQRRSLFEVGSPLGVFGLRSGLGNLEVKPPSLLLLQAQEEPAMSPGPPSPGGGEWLPLSGISWPVPLPPPTGHLHRHQPDSSG